MKKFLVNMVCLITSFSGFAQNSAEKLTIALNKAYEEIRRLEIKNDDLKHLSEYFEFYASWYAPVTPATKELYDSLSKQALDLIEKIKNIAKPLERNHNRRLMGASRLSDEGKFFYKKIIAALRCKLKKQK
ncbi:MAG: hypothetical protein K2X90_03595 [Candidatus Babeliaceae bacterium]|nr:hypothetical protein [Candidatus Babeliaceae bacterium]